MVKRTVQGLFVGLVVDEQPKEVEVPTEEVVEEQPKQKKPRKKKAE